MAAMPRFRKTQAEQQPRVELFAQPLRWRRPCSTDRSTTAYRVRAPFRTEAKLESLAISPLAKPQTEMPE